MENQNDKTAKILDKIRKLMKLQKSSEEIGNIHEAENAAQAVQRLLMEYNLSMSEVGEFDKTDKKEGVIEDGEQAYRDKGMAGQWKMKLAEVIAAWNYCKVLMRPRKKVFFLIGTPSNIEVVRYLTDMLSEKFLLIASREYKTYCKKLNEERARGFYTEIYSYQNFQRRFCEGAVIGLNAKFKAERGEERKEFGETKVDALVVMNEKAIVSFVAKKYPKLGHAGGGGGFANDNVKRDGYNTGRNTTLNSGRIGNPNGSKTFALNK